MIPRIVNRQVAAYSLKAMTQIPFYRFTDAKQNKVRMDVNKKIKEEWQKLKKQFEEFSKDQRIRNFGNIPSEDQEKYAKRLYYLAAFMVAAYGMYLLKREDARQVSADQIFQFLNKSQADTLYILYEKPEHIKRQSSQKNQSKGFSDSENLLSQKQPRIRVYMYVKGQKVYALIENTKGFLTTVNAIENRKSNFKTKIIENQFQSFDEKLKKIFRFSTKLLIPIMIPILLFYTNFGKLFKNKLLGKSDGLRPKTLFKDIAGLGESKIEVSQLVDFLKDPTKYKKMGARIPKGALLVGPPGTGKTMLAKACAGQAQVPFFSVSGSQFVELFAGMGARRVRQLFANAKRQTPAIIFIDQIDAIGRKRQDKFGGANDQRANTLNQLLVEMDGFQTSDDIIVLAATNRKEMLDNALTRPGRFDRMIQIQLPDIRGRQEILQIYLQKIKLSPTQNLKDYARRVATLTFGFSGADLANLCNQASILAVRQAKQFVQPIHFENASDRVLAGLQKTLKMDYKQKKKVAYHQCGHAVTAWFLEGASPLLKITIVPRSKGSLGFAQYLPNEATLMTKQQLLDQVCVILGGRTAEQVFFNQVSNGAADDLQKVRQLARGLITSYGMGTKHPNYAPVETDGHNVFSEQTGAEIDMQILQLITQCTERTRQLVNNYKDKIEALAEQVLKKQTLNHQQIKQILGERPFQIRQNYRQFLGQTVATTNFKSQLLL